MVMKSSVGVSYSAFWGIPYTKPPVGKLRFANPEPNDPWEGTYDATKPKNACIQYIVLVPSAPMFGVEDCLYLNVFVPDRNAHHSDLLPVMVYIHGGSFAYGSAQPEQRNPSRFMSSRKVIIVTFQYRLGVLGFFSTGDSAAPGNFGMKDQVMVLRWVQKNIQAFGGDPNHVTIFGESAGGASTQLHMMSPLSKGLFHRAVSMSGSAISAWSVPIENPLELARNHAKVLGIVDAETLPTADLIEKLRDVDAAELITSAELLKVWDIHPVVFYHPVVEPVETPEAFLTEDPRVAWRRGAYASVPWLTGSIPKDGSFVTQTVYRNNSLIEDLNKKFTTLLPLVVRTRVTENKLMRLRKRFLKNTSPINWITKDNYDEITKMISEAWFLYPMMRSIKQHLANRKRSPISVYSFEFLGQYSFSALYTGTDKPYGITHLDDVIYLFQIPLLFPDFTARSPEAEMSKLWVKLILDFATNELAAKDGTCYGKKCDVITFNNTYDPHYPVRRTISQGLDEEMYTFWKSFFEDVA
uniref:Carboxylic ester hydrolase n=1 Tax=Anopheles culicifacies TaxID=139723 RepID=A0A182M6S5_9DIPT